MDMRRLRYWEEGQDHQRIEGMCLVVKCFAKISASFLINFVFLTSVFSLALIVLLTSCTKSENSRVESPKKYKVQQKLSINEMLVLSNKTIGVTFLDLTSIEKSRVDYRWRRWDSIKSEEKAGTGTSTIIRLKAGKDETIYVGNGSFLKVGDARLMWDVGGDDSIMVMYQLGDTAVWVLPDANFDLLSPSVGFENYKMVDQTNSLPLQIIK